MFVLISNPSWLYNGSLKLTCFSWLAIVVVVMSFVDGLHAERYIIHQVYVGQYFQYDLLQNMTWYNRPMVIQIKIYNSTPENQELPDWLEVGNDYSLHGLPLDSSEGHFTILLFCHIQKQNIKLCHSINLHLNVVHSQYSLYHSIEKYREISNIKHLDNCLSDTSKILIHTIFLSPQNFLTPLHLLNMLKNLTRYFDYDINLMQVSMSDSPYIFYKQLHQLSIHTSNAVLEFENLTVLVSWAFSCSHTSNHHHIRKRSLENNMNQSASIYIRSWHITSGVLNRQKRKVEEKIFFGSITALMGTPIETSSLDSAVQTTSSFVSSRILNATSVSYNTSAGQSKLSINTNSLSKKIILPTFDSVGSKSSVKISYFFTRYENISRTVSVIKSTHSDNITLSTSSNLVGSFKSLSTLVANLTSIEAFPPTKSQGNISQSFLVYTRSKAISKNMILSSTTKAVPVNISTSILTVVSTEITDRTYTPPSKVTSAYFNSTFLLKHSYSLAMTSLSYFTLYKPSFYSTAYHSLINTSLISQSLISSLSSKTFQSITPLLSSVSSSYSFVTSVIRTISSSSLTKTEISRVSVSRVLSLALTHYSTITSSSILIKRHSIVLKSFLLLFNQSISSSQTLVTQTVSHSAFSASTLLTSVSRLHFVPSSILSVSISANTLVIPTSIKASFSISPVVNSSLKAKNLSMSSYLRVATFSSSRNFTLSILEVFSFRIFASNPLNTMKSKTFSSPVNRNISSIQTVIVRTVSQNASSTSILFTSASRLYYVPSSFLSVSVSANTLVVPNISVATKNVPMSSYLKFATFSSSRNFIKSILEVPSSKVFATNPVSTMKSKTFSSPVSRNISTIQTLIVRTVSQNASSTSTPFTSVSRLYYVPSSFLSVSISANTLVVPNSSMATKNLPMSSYLKFATFSSSRNFTKSILEVSSSRAFASNPLIALKSKTSSPFNRNISSIQTLVVQTVSQNASSVSTLFTSVSRLYSVPSSFLLVSISANTLVVPNSTQATKNVPMSSYLKVATFSSSRNFTLSILVVSSRNFASNPVNTMKSNTFSSPLNRNISSIQTMIVQTVSRNASSSLTLFTNVSRLHSARSTIFLVSTGTNILVVPTSIKALFSVSLVVNSSLATNRLPTSLYMRVGTSSSSRNFTLSTLLVSYSSVIVSNSMNTMKSISFSSPTNRSISSIQTFSRTLSLNTPSAPIMLTRFSASHTVSRSFMSVSTSSNVAIASSSIVHTSLKASFSINSFINTSLATKKLSTSSYTRVATLPPSRKFTQSTLLVSSRVVFPDSTNASGSAITGMSSKFSYSNRNEVSASITSANSTYSEFYESSLRSKNQTVRLSLTKLLSSPEKELTLTTKHMNETLPASNYVSRMSVLLTSFTNISFESTLSKSSHTDNASLVFSTSASRRKLFNSTLVTQSGTITSTAPVLTTKSSNISSQIIRVTTSEMFKSNFPISVEKSSLSKSTTSKKSHSRQLLPFLNSSRLIFKSFGTHLLNETVMTKLESVRFSTTLLLTSSVKLPPVSKRTQNLTHITSLGLKLSSISVDGYKRTSSPVISSKKIAMLTVSPPLPHSTLISLSFQYATPDSRSNSTASSFVVKNTITSVSSSRLSSQRPRSDFTEKTLLHNSSIISLVKRISKTYIFNIHVSSQHVSVLPTISTTVNLTKLFSFTSDTTPSTSKLSSEISSNINLTKTVASSSLTVTASFQNVSVTRTISSIAKLTKFFFSGRSDMTATTTVMSFESSHMTNQRKTIQSPSKTFLVSVSTLITQFARSTSKINILTESVNSSRNRSLTLLSELKSANRNRTSRIKESLSTSERRSVKSIVANRTMVSLKHSARISPSVYITQFTSYASSKLSPVRSNLLSRTIPKSSSYYSKTFNTSYSAAQTRRISSIVFSKLTKLGIVTATLSITTSLGEISSANLVSKLLTSSNIIAESSQKSFIATEDTSYVIFNISRSSRTTVNLVTSVSHLSVNTLSIKILPTSELPVSISPLKASSLSVVTLSVSITKSIFLPSPINSSLFLVRSSVPRTSGMVFTLSIKVTSRLPVLTFPITLSKQVVMSLSPTISSSLGISTSVSTYTSLVTVSLVPSSPVSVILSSVTVSKLSTILSVITISKPSTKQKPITTTKISLPSSTTSSELPDLPSTLKISGFSVVRPLLTVSRSSIILSKTSVTRSKARIIPSSTLTISPSQVTLSKLLGTSTPVKTSKLSVLSSLQTRSESPVILSTVTSPSITWSWLATSNVSYKPSLLSTSVLSVMKSTIRTSKLSVLQSLVTMSELPVMLSTTIPSMLTILPSSETTHKLSTILSLLKTSMSAAFPSFVTTSTVPVIQSAVKTIEKPVLQSSVTTSELQIKLSSPSTATLVEISPWASSKLLFILSLKSTTKSPVKVSTLTTPNPLVIDSLGTSSMEPITTTSIFVQSTTGPTKTPNNAPKLVSPIPHLFAETGYLFQYKIKESTFTDVEDGSTRNLTLKILFLNNESLSAKSWLAFNTSSHMLYGLPLNSDYKKQISKPLDLILFAYDKDGRYAFNSFKLSISEPINSVPFIVTIRLALNYTVFMTEKQYPALLINKIASYYNDSQSRIYIQSIEEGSTLVSWSNTSLGINICNNTEIESNTDKIINKNLNTPRKDFAQHLLPEFPLIGIQSEFQGVCVVNTTIVTKFPPTTAEKDNTFIYFIIPVVILGIILLIVVILIISFWKNRRKNTVYFKNHERPVLLPDEVELRQVSEVASREKEVPYKREYDDIGLVHDNFESSSSFSSGTSSMSSNSMSMDIRGPPPPYRMPPKYIKPVGEFKKHIHLNSTC